MADEDDPEEYLPLGAEIVDSEKSFWEPALQPYIDERHKCIWALGELNNRYAKIIFELKAIKDFVQDWFRVPDKFYVFSRTMNNAVRDAWSARELALAASTEAKEAARLAEKFAMSEPVNNITNYRGQTYLREDGVRVKHGYGVIRYNDDIGEDEEFDEEEVDEDDIFTYSGQYEDGERSGRGIWTCMNVIFRGSFSAGESNGYGVSMIYEDNSRTGSAKGIYLGHGRNGQRSGPGVDINNEDKSTFSGNWESHKISGLGRLRYDEYNYIDGNWIDDGIDGEGREVFENAVCEGKFKRSQLNGLGKVRYPDGELQIGEFSDNKLHGLSKAVFRDGSVLEGVFIDGKPCRQVTARYVGETKDDKAHGIGRRVLSDGSIQQGKFSEGLFETDLYDGETLDGQKCGRGKLVKRDGSIEDGLWFEDKLVKVCHEPPIQVTSPDATK